MEKFIMIPGESIRHGTADMMLNVSSIVTMTTRLEREFPAIILQVKPKETLIVTFNNQDGRQLVYDAILAALEPTSVISTPESIKAPKERKERSRD